MISAEAAQNLVVKNSSPLQPVEATISDALHLVLSETIVSQISYPPFSQSAMDGFAIRFSDFQKSIPLKISGESAAGIPFSEKIMEGQAVRIFTGAKIPEGADTVIVQENAAVESGKLIIRGAPLERALNIRNAGSQIKKGDAVLAKGKIVTPAVIGLLASLGIAKVNVFPSPRVTLVVTGNELRRPGSSLHDGQVYESNSFAIHAALKSINIKSVQVMAVDDDEKKIVKKLKAAITKSDIILTIGGISAGKYDFVGSALQQLTVRNIFYKVAQRPGKPLFFGVLNSCLIFGLPGNPAAALTCFYEYVFPAVKIMQGHQNIFLKKQKMPLAGSVLKKEGLSLFLRGKISEGKVKMLTGQESSNIRSFTNADCLIYLPAEKGNVTDGEPVEAHLLTFPIFA